MITRLEINAIATRALVDKEFEAAILNGQRKERLQEFRLPESVANNIMQFRGENLQQFIYQLYNLVESPAMM
jgi:translation initiation factor RLI1